MYCSILHCTVVYCIVLYCAAVLDSGKEGINTRSVEMEEKGDKNVNIENKRKGKQIPHEDTAASAFDHFM